MDLSFNKVDYDGELAEFSEDELRELISEFETAQDSNVAEFEKAVEATDEIDDSTIEDFEQARASLIGEITGAEAFDEVPLTEEMLEDEDFSDLQEWREFVSGGESETEPEGDEADEGDEGDFDDFGTKSPSESGENTEDFVEDELGQMPGLCLD
jgi:hypothetical protein